MSGKAGNVVDPAGGSLESFFDGTGDRDEVYGAAIKAVISWQMEECRKEKHVTKSAMATKMGTSRTQVERVLDPTNVAVSLGMLAKAAHSLGKRLNVELVDSDEATAV